MQGVDPFNPLGRFDQDFNPCHEVDHLVQVCGSLVIKGITAAEGALRELDVGGADPFLDFLVNLFSVIDGLFFVYHEHAGTARGQEQDAEQGQEPAHRATP